MKTTLCFTLTLLSFVTLAFVPNSFAQDASPEYIVQVIYFYPNDRQPQAEIDTILETLMKKVQQFYANGMERHGFGGKTFQLETDASEKLIVHRVKGRYANMHYYDAPSRIDAVLRDIEEQFDRSNKIIYLYWIDLYDPFTYESQVGGNAGGNSFGGSAQLTATNFERASGQLYIRAWAIIAHELGHAFGLWHDFRDERYIMSYGDYILTDQLSYCAAEWLDVHRYFNANPNVFDGVPTIEMLPPTSVPPSNTIRLQFEVTHSEKIHQAQLFTNSLAWSPTVGPVLLDCKSLNGNSGIIEFDTVELALGSEYVALQVIDIHGNFTFSQRFPIDIAAFQFASEVVSIPDANLAAAITESLGLPVGNTITQLDMLGLGRLNAPQKQISDITGLQHASNLKYIDLNENQIVDLAPLEELTQLRSLLIRKNKIDDISPLTGLTQLSTLWISNNQISNINSLAGLTNLTILHIGSNKISGVRPLAGLTNLRDLDLPFNQISDVSPLAGLTKLGYLNLWNNQISDVRSLVGFTNLEELNLVGNPLKNQKLLLALLRQNPNAKIFLKNLDEPLPVTLSSFRAERADAGVVLKWTTESELDNAGFNILRSETKNGRFKTVNSKLIQGAGTTSERHTYTWKDTTAKPNVVYYYRIEDISHAGVRKQLATVRMRGYVSAVSKFTTRWADLKLQD